MAARTCGEEPVQSTVSWSPATVIATDRTTGSSLSPSLSIWSVKR